MQFTSDIKLARYFDFVEYCYDGSFTMQFLPVDVISYRRERTLFASPDEPHSMRKIVTTST